MWILSSWEEHKFQSWVTQFISIPYSKQDIDTGCYKKEGFVIHSELAKDSNVALTASLLITMLEDENADLQG